MNKPFKILAMAGSIRKKSYNMALLNSAAGLASDRLRIKIFDLTDIPMFNEDLEKDPPPIITEFKMNIAEADGLLFATPEYNYSIPGVLKNAIDWASRPSGASPLDMKPIAIMGGAIGMSGTIRSQLHLRQMAVSANMMDMKKPEVLVTRIQEKFDEDLNLIDESLKEYLKKFLESYENWITIFKNFQPAAAESSWVMPFEESAVVGFPESAKFWTDANIE